MVFPMFPFKAASMAGAAQKGQGPLILDPPPTRRRGLFGGLFGGQSQRTQTNGVNDSPSFWEWLTLGPQAPDVLDQRRARRNLFGQGIRDQKQEDFQGQQLEQAIGQLDPAMQPWARLAPEAAARQALGGSDAGRLATPEEVAALNAEPGTIIWFGADGEPRVVYRPRAGRASHDAEPQLGPGDEWVN